MRPTNKEVYAAALAIAAAALAGCSGSSSSGGSGSPSASARPTETIGGPFLTSPGAVGPNGHITAPASNAPSRTSPGGSEVFPHVSNAERKRLTTPLLKFAGVRTVTYYPQFRQLQIYYKAGTTSAERDAVYRYVVAHVPATVPSAASSTPAATSTAAPTPSAS